MLAIDRSAKNDNDMQFPSCLFSRNDLVQCGENYRPSPFIKYFKSIN